MLHYTHDRIAVTHGLLVLNQKERELMDLIRLIIQNGYVLEPNDISEIL
jgi:hypothetical protein